jgi:hypothetical protein
MMDPGAPGQAGLGLVDLEMKFCPGAFGFWVFESRLTVVIKIMSRISEIAPKGQKGSILSRVHARDVGKCQAV